MGLYDDLYEAMRGETAAERNTRYGLALGHDSQSERNAIAELYRVADIRWAVQQLKQIEADRERLVDESRD